MDPIYRISVTTLEKYRRYINEVSSYDTEESLLESIRGIFTGNDKTRVGGAFHKIIEGDYVKKGNRVIADEIAFTKEQAQVAFDYKARHKSMIHEISIRKTFETNFFPIQVSGRIDGCEGLNTHDAKTKFSEVKFQEYINSSQWKFYLQMLDANVFYYDLFEVQGFKELGRLPWSISKDVQFIAHEPLQCLRYETMHADIMVILNGFLDYLHNRKIVHLLKPAILEPELNF